MNKQLPTSMIVLSTVVAVGMLGSQLEIGGLSGQAAGGESAGCGGDSYYDEDLGEIVGTDAPSVDEDALVVDQGMAGVLMEGQSRIRILTPLEHLATETDETFVSRAAITDDGQYALVTFSASEDASQLNHLQLLQYDEGRWLTLLTLEGQEDEPLAIRAPSFDFVIPMESGDRLFFNLGFPLMYEFNVTTQRLSSIFTDPSSFMGGAPNYGNLPGQSSDRLERAEHRFEGEEVSELVRAGVVHPWLESLMASTYGEDAQYSPHIADNGRMVVTGPQGDVLLVEVCEAPTTPSLLRGELICERCLPGHACDDTVQTRGE